VAPLRLALEAEARAKIQFETPPGNQLQIAFGERRVSDLWCKRQGVFCS
jgi:hypothetical protein